MSETVPNESPYGGMPDKVYQVYREERQKYTEVEQDYSKILDRNLVTLSGGAIALSVACLDDIVGDKPIVHAWLLLCAWLFLIVAIVSNVVSVWLTPQAFREYRDILDVEAEKGGERYWTRVRKEHNCKSKPTTIRHLNLLSLLTFVIGLVLLLLFSYGSVAQKDAAMLKDSNSTRLVDTDANGTGGPLRICQGGAVVDRVGEIPDNRGLAPPNAPVDQAPPKPVPAPPPKID